MSERHFIYKGRPYRSLREINDRSFAFYNTQGVRKALHDDLPLEPEIVAREMDGLTYLAWKGVSLMPAKKTFDIAVAVACILDSQNRHVTIGDIGTGSGVFPITVASLLDGKSDYYATDISGKTLEVAALNATVNGLPPGKINWKRTNGLAGLSSEVGGFDVIFSNPPFTRSSEVSRVNKSNFNPDLALDGGIDGAQFYRQFAREAMPMLKRDGVLIFQLPLEEEGIGQVVRAVHPLFPQIPMHLLSDCRGRYTQRFPLFMTVGGPHNLAAQFGRQHYHAERL